MEVRVIKRPYTLREHAKRVLWMLENNNNSAYGLRSICPAQIFVKRGKMDGNRPHHFNRLWGNSEEFIHEICIDFIGADKTRSSIGQYKCPCHQLDCKEAIKRTWIALEEKYLNDKLFIKDCQDIELQCYTPLTLDQAKKLTYRTDLFDMGTFNTQGYPKVWRVNGKPKVWKRSPERVQVPIKYGLWAYDYLTERNLEWFGFPSSFRNLRGSDKIAD